MAYIIGRNAQNRLLTVLVRDRSSDTLPAKCLEVGFDMNEAIPNLYLKEFDSATILVALTVTGRLMVWDLLLGAPLHLWKLSRRGEEVTSLDYNPDTGLRIVVRCENLSQNDGFIQIRCPHGRSVNDAATLRSLFALFHERPAIQGIY
jgi:hypothetical protein